MAGESGNPKAKAAPRRRRWRLLAAFLLFLGACTVMYFFLRGEWQEAGGFSKWATSLFGPTSQARVEPKRDGGKVVAIKPKGTAGAAGAPGTAGAKGLANASEDSRPGALDEALAQTWAEEKARRARRAGGGASGDGEPAMKELVNRREALFFVTDPETGRRELAGMKAIVYEHGIGGAVCGSFSRDGRLVASGSGDGKVWVWEARYQSSPYAFDSGGGCVYSLDFLPGDEALIGNTQYGNTTVWTLDDPYHPTVWRGTSGKFPEMSLSADQRRFAVPFSGGGVWVVSLDSGWWHVGSERGVFEKVALSPDGRQVVAANKEIVGVWKLDRKFAEDPDIEFPVNGGASLDPRGEWFTNRTPEGDIEIQRTDASAPGTKLDRDGSRIRWVLAGEDGRSVFGPCADGVIRVWRTDGTVIARLRGASLSEVKYGWSSPDGRWIAFSYADFTVRLFDLRAAGDPILLNGHTAWIREVRFSPDGRRVLTASDDTTMRVWPLPEEPEKVGAAKASGAAKAPPPAP